jgi:hypothetical protein
MATGPGPYAKRNSAEVATDAGVVFDLRLQGLSFREIDVLSQTPDGPTGGRRIARSQAGDLLREEIARRVHPKAEEWRTLQLDRLDAVLRDHIALRNAHWNRAMGSEEKAPEVAAALAVDRALNGVTRTVAEQNKLLGIATTKIEATVTEVTQADVELAELIREAKAKNAAEEARIKGGEGE